MNEEFEEAEEEIEKMEKTQDKKESKDVDLEIQENSKTITLDQNEIVI